MHSRSTHRGLVLRPRLVQVLDCALLVDTYPPPSNLPASHGQNRASLWIAWARGGVDSVDADSEESE